jgi:hypothetical protein
MKKVVLVGHSFTLLMRESLIKLKVGGVSHLLCYLLGAVQL